jgi:hypothetical protein
VDLIPHGNPAARRATRLSDRIEVAAKKISETKFSYLLGQRLAKPQRAAMPDHNNQAVVTRPTGQCLTKVRVVTMRVVRKEYEENPTIRDNLRSPHGLVEIGDAAGSCAICSISIPRRRRPMTTFLNASFFLGSVAAAWT